jgi:hypothetical protein
MPSSNQDHDVRVPPRERRVESGHYSIDLSNAHDDESLSRAPWDELVRCPTGVAELSIPGREPLVQSLPLGSLDDAVTAAVGQWFGDEALRHWFAFRTLPVDHGRVSWRVDPHLGILGESLSEATRERATLEIERLTRISMTILTPRRDLRLFALLLVPIARTERATGSRWLLRDMIVRVHPLLVSDDDGPPTEPIEPSDDTLNEQHTRTLAR